MRLAPMVPLVTTKTETVKPSSVGVKRLGLWRMACWVRTIESGVGARN